MRRTTTLLLIVATMSIAACSGDADEPSEETAAAAAVELGPELLAASGFEAGVEAEWLVEAEDPGQIAQIAGDGDGNSFIEMSAELAEEARWPQVIQQGRIPLIAGERYRLALRARSDDFGLVFASVAFEDASGDEFLALGPGSLTVDSSEWTDYHFAFEAPDGAAAGYVILRLALNKAMTDEQFLSADVDDVSLKRIER